MDNLEIHKLKIEKFQHISWVNFPKEFEISAEFAKNTEVIIYYIDTLNDVKKFVELCNKTPLPKENRTIMVYKKGRKDEVKRDTIVLPFREKKIEGFAFKAPMLCSLSKELSAFVFTKNIK